MPVGMALALAASPLILSAAGWRLWWELNAALLAALALAVAWSNSRVHQVRSRRSTQFGGMLRASLLRPGVLLLAAIFASYAFQFLSIMGFLPTILQERGIAPRAAGGLTALAVIVNAGGNLTAGWLVTRGVAPRTLICTAMIGMVGAELVVFSPWYSASLQYLAAVGFSAIGGLVPASIFTAVPDVAPADHGHRRAGLAHWPACRSADRCGGRSRGGRLVRIAAGPGAARSPRVGGGLVAESPSVAFKLSHQYRRMLWRAVPEKRRRLRARR